MTVRQLYGWSFVCFAVLCGGIVTRSVFADDDEDQDALTFLRERSECRIKLRRARIFRMEREIAELKKSKRAKSTAEDIRNIQADISTMRREIAALQKIAEATKLPELELVNTQVVGRIVRRLRNVQIVDDEEFTAQLHLFRKGREEPEVFQRLIVRGFKTDGLKDGGSTVLTSPVMILRTEMESKGNVDFFTQAYIVERFTPERAKADIEQLEKETAAAP